MTTRERTSLVLILGGAVALLVAAYAYDGWRAAVAVAGTLGLVCGVLLGIDEPVAASSGDAADAGELGP